MTAPKRNLPDPTHFLVCEKRCRECLFTPNKIVDEQRKEQLLAQIEADDTYFVCHKGTIAGNDQLCCRGFYDQYATLPVRLAKALKLVRFVPIPDTERQFSDDENEPSS